MAANLIAQTKALSHKLRFNQKLSLGALGAVVLFGTLFFTYLLRSEPYQLLFSNLDAVSAQAITERLEQLEIPYQLTEGGRSISVPGEKVAVARIEIMSEGLPANGHVGFEIFDNSSFGSSEFDQNVKFLRALSGELEKTIIALNEVVQARVHLVLGSDSVFLEEEKPAKASVVIKTRYGMALSRARTKGIQNVVAYAVEGLSPENVTVMDVEGNLLSDTPSAEEALTEVQLGLRREIEQKLNEKVAMILEPIVGRENVRVTTSVEVDFTETNQQELLYQPNNTVVLSRQLSTEQVGKIVETEGGVPFQANDQSVSQDTEIPKRTRDMQVELTNYKVGETRRQIRIPSGTVRRQSVAVVVNDQLVTTTDADGKKVEEYQPRTSDQMERIRNVIAATIGLDESRGDTLIVENLSFSSTPVETTITAKKPGVLERYENYIYPIARYLLIFVMFGLFYLVIFRPVKNRVFSYIEVEETPLAQLTAAIKDPELLQQLEAHMKNPDGTLALPEGRKQKLDPKVEANQQLIHLAKDDPQVITQVIKNWLSEGV